MDGDDHSIAATSLRAAYGGPAIEPLTRTFPGMTVDDAYTVQQLQVQAWQSQGRSVIGHKVGLTSRAMRRQLGVDQPDYGRLTADMVFAEGEALQPERFLQPKIEPEIAFVLGADLTGPGVTVVQAIRAVDHVLPAIEVIDSRIRDWEIALVDTIADNASSAAVVLGSRPVRLADVDLRLTGCVLTVNGEVAATGAGGAVLGSPLTALVWLANVLGSRGVGLEAGQVVIPGSLTAAQPLTAGSVVSAQFGGLGTLTTRMGRSTR